MNYRVTRERGPNDCHGVYEWQLDGVALALDLAPHRPARIPDRDCAAAARQ
jgi:hypothetical protein